MQQYGLEDASERKRPKNQKIGSIKNNKLDYPPDQKFFHPMDVNEKVATAPLALTASLGQEHGEGDQGLY